MVNVRNTTGPWKQNSWWRKSVGALCFSLFAINGSVFSADEESSAMPAPATKNANAGPGQGFGQGNGRLREMIRQRFGERGGFGERPATLPANVEGIPVTVTQDRVNLTLESGDKIGKPMTTAQLDELMTKELAAEGVSKPTKRITDALFVRRVYLDVVGRLPSPADVDEYSKDRSPDKKAKLIDRLLSMPQYGVNWARYWRDVIDYRSTAGMFRNVPWDIETWLAEQLNQNKPWDEIVGMMLDAKGLSNEAPQGYLYGSHGMDTAELAGEVSRIFMGIQISCAQCHDHPSDTWKRDQFHEFASFFGRTTVRLRQDLFQMGGPPVFEVATIQMPSRQYRKPDLKDPSKPGELVAPVFLTGQAIPQNTSDEQRKSAAAAFLTNKRNPYFSRAFVNRIWAELIGYGFTNPVDDLGSQRPVTYPALFEALAHSFAASDYNIKELMRLILNSQAYDRAFKELEGSYEDEILFTAVTPTRLNSDQIFDSLDWVLGNIDDSGSARGGRYARFGSRFMFRSVFGFDPSVDPADIEGTVPQALILMNNPTINARLDSKRSGTLLNKLLAKQSNDSKLIDILYLRVLARHPSREETSACQAHIRQVKDRGEAFEDILWALINSTEFLNNH